MKENAGFDKPAGYKPENDLAVNSGGVENEFYFNKDVGKWVRRGQEQ